MAQQQGNFWYFGDMAGVEFSTGEPVVLTDGAIETFEGSATMSDADGNLLFYTNGGGRDPDLSGQTSGKIWNRNHEVMYDMGNEEGGGFSARQSSIIIPKPGTDEQYYLFTMEEVEYNIGGSVPGQPLGRGMSYFEIDMTLNGGLGGVTGPPQSVYIPLYESMTGTLHGNGQDYWIVSADNNSGNNRFVLVLVNGDGVQDPVFIDMPPTLPIGGMLKMSPDGRWLYSNGFLFGFDRFIGAISALGIDLQNEGSSTSSFSPNSRYFYTAFDNDDEIAVVQYDLDADNIPGSANTFGGIADDFTSTGQMQMAPNGNLYFLEVNFFSYDPPILSEIQCPNTPNPVLNRNVVALSTGESYPSFSGLPNFTDHLFAMEYMPPTVDLGSDTFSICGSETVLLDAGNPGSTYEWSTGETSQTIEVGSEGVYTVEVTDACGVQASASVVVLVESSVNNASIEGPDFVCDDAPVLLSVIAEGTNSYAWSTGDTTAQVSVLQPGEYAVTVTSGCDGEEVVLVTELGASQFPEVEIFAGESETFCQGDTVILVSQSTNADSILWSTGASTDSIVIANDSNQVVTLTAFNECGPATAELDLVFLNCDSIECQIAMPNVFTPNNDGDNDTFGYVSDCDGLPLPNFSMKIFNRWGNMVYESDESDEPWDGQFSGSPQPVDVYFYYVEYSNPRGPRQDEVRTFQGNVTLLR